MLDPTLLQISAYLFPSQKVNGICMIGSSNNDVMDPYFLKRCNLQRKVRKFTTNKVIKIY